MKGSKELYFLPVGFVRVFLWNYIRFIDPLVNRCLGVFFSACVISEAEEICGRLLYFSLLLHVLMNNILEACR